MLDVPRTADGDFPFQRVFPRCLVMLDHAVQESLDHPSDHYCRTRAVDIAQALVEGCRVCGYHEDTGILESITVLLAAPFDGSDSTISDLRERFRGLLGVLKSQALVRSA